MCPRRPRLPPSIHSGAFLLLLRGAVRAWRLALPSGRAGRAGRSQRRRRGRHRRSVHPERKAFCHACMAGLRTLSQSTRSFCRRLQQPPPPRHVVSLRRGPRHSSLAHFAFISLFRGSAAVQPGEGLAGRGLVKRTRAGRQAEGPGGAPVKKCGRAVDAGRRGAARAAGKAVSMNSISIRRI